MLWYLVALIAAGLCLNLVAFVACALDKRRAVTGARRIRERTLLTLAFLGGSLGLILGMLVAHHKTSKGSFLVRLLLIVALQAALMAWYIFGAL